MGSCARHELKTWPVFFREVVANRKTVEVRKDDRRFQVGDTLVLQEYSPSNDYYTGDVCERLVTHIVPGGQFGIEQGYVAMSIRPAEESQ
ncbi:MAG: ASCH/PUA domain-containing protein [Mycobacterium sp.]